jgi:ketosteroid isomerase-like protein
MSEENVETVRATVDAWNRGDWDGALAHTSPDFVLDNSTAIGEWRGVHRGADQVRRMWQTFTDPWESVRVEISEFIEADEQVVLTRMTSRFVGRDGIELPGPVRSGWLWTFRDGALVKLVIYNDLDDALEAAGLSE